MAALPDRFPAPVYTETVLRQNFDDAKRFFLDPLIEIHYAHTVMLTEQGIVSRDEARQLFAALDALNIPAIRATEYSGQYEDLFFYVEQELARLAPPDVAGKMHTARSRNDIDLTLYRMTVRDELLAVLAAVLQLQEVLLNLAAQHVDTVMPAHTHTQPAQPTTLAHYLLGPIECLSRDAVRLRAAYATVNRNPLGACAITTTGFPIRRERTAELLGFDGLQVNSIGAIAAVDYIAESAAAVAVCVLTLGKFVQDQLLWCTREFGYLRLGDAFVQCSSIMPQKRNPVALEHARILASRALAGCQSLFTAEHNTPFGDIVDSEDDLQPLVFGFFDEAKRALRLVAGAMSSATVNRGLLRQRAGADFLTVTELADTLVREAGLDFRQAHHLVSGAVKADPNNDRHERIVDHVLQSAQQAGITLTVDRARLLQALDPQHFVAVRNIVGGPAPERVRPEIDQHRSEGAGHQQWITERQTALAKSREARATAVAQLRQL